MKTFKQLLEGKEYPNVGNTLEGLRVTDNIPNLTSIRSSLYEYTILKGVRKVPMSVFGGPRSTFYASNDFNRARELSKEIESNKYIDPLITLKVTTEF